MGALGHYIERAGVATTSISLVRPQTERLRPPRALWVPFPLGRPLGTAGDPAFQTAVIRAALGLVTTATGPTIEDYPIEAPADAGPERWACPISLNIPVDDSPTGRLQAEVDRLRPWAAETRNRRGRTVFGASGATPDQVDAVVAALGALAEGADPAATPPGEVDWALESPLLIRLLANDLKAFYHEAVAARPAFESPNPGAASANTADPGAPNHDALNGWIYGETVLGEVLRAIVDALPGRVDERTEAQLRLHLIPTGYAKP